MCSKGRRQSPIDIEPDKLLFDPYLRPLHIDKHKVKCTKSLIIEANKSIDERGIFFFHWNRKQNQSNSDAVYKLVIDCFVFSAKFISVHKWDSSRYGAKNNKLKLEYPLFIKNCLRSK